MSTTSTTAPAPAQDEIKLVTDGQLQFAQEKGIVGVVPGMLREQASRLIQDWCAANPKPGSLPMTPKQVAMGKALGVFFPKGCRRHVAGAILHRASLKQKAAAAASNLPCDPAPARAEGAATRNRVAAPSRIQSVSRCRVAAHTRDRTAPISCHPRAPPCEPY